MLVIGIISSPHPEGSSAALTRGALKGAAAAGATVEEVYLPGYRIDFCQDCGHCLTEGGCVLSDDFEDLKRRLQAADGIILSSPVYAGSYSAMLKRFFERLGMYEFLTSSLGGKHLAGIATAAGGGAGKVAKAIVAPLSSGVFQRCYVSGTLGVSVGGGRAASDNQSALRQAYELGQKLVADISKGNRHPGQNLPNRLLSQYVIRPQFKKAIAAHRDGRLRAVYRNLKQRSLI